MAKPLQGNKHPNQPEAEIDPRRLQRDIDKLNAETEEEVDALRVNLLQDDEVDTARDGTGRVVDDVAEQAIAGFTEVGPLAEDRGGVSLTPGRDDPSSILKRHHPNTEVVLADDLVEDSLDEPRDEGTLDRKADDGRAA